MRNYDFTVLTPHEFELFSRDILQRLLGVTLESFKEGKDCGIDARFCNDINKQIVIQSKRYNNFSSLMSILKAELVKVIKLHPNRYILTTSIGLSPKNKEEIITLFNPYIKAPSDILGRDELNNLLNQHPDIEKNYYKLWLSSVDILNKILHNGVGTQSAFDKEDLLEEIKRYVNNGSLIEAEKVLNENRVVIISGIPGIGKTTLAKALSHKLIADGPPELEFVSLGQNINEAHEVYDPNKSQLFYFDDFLGSNFLSNNLEKNEGRIIAQFIEKISKSNNKFLICTTREYILQQAKQKNEKLNQNDQVELAKYVIDIEKYTTLIKAKILYNHLFFSNLDIVYFNEVLANKKYLRVIQHQNFNPRIIELVTKKVFVRNIPPDQYVSKVISYLNNPEAIWKDAYEDQISDLSQIILLIVSTSGTPMMYDDLFEAVDKFTKKYYQGLNFSSITFDKSLKELENTFFQTNIKSNSLFIEFQNPSIVDFLRSYVLCHPDLAAKLAVSSCFLNQLSNISSLYESSIRPDAKNFLFGKIRNKLIEDFDMLNFSTQYRSILADKGEEYLREMPTIINKLYKIINHVNFAYGDNLESFLVQRLKSVTPGMIHDHNLDSYIRIIKKLSKANLNLNFEQLLPNIIKNLNFVSSLNVFYEFQTVCPKEFDEYVSTSEAQTSIMSILRDEINNSTLNYSSFIDLSNFSEELSSVGHNYSIDVMEDISKLEEEIGELERAEDSRYDDWVDMARNDGFSRSAGEAEDLKEVDNLFSTLV